MRIANALVTAAVIAGFRALPGANPGMHRDAAGWAGPRWR